MDFEKVNEREREKKPKALIFGRKENESAVDAALALLLN